MTKYTLLGLVVLLAGCGGDPSEPGASDSACEIGHHACGDLCRPNADVLSCGDTSCIPCPVPVNGVATCDGSHCGFACATATGKTPPVDSPAASTPRVHP